MQILVFVPRDLFFYFWYYVMLDIISYTLNVVSSVFHFEIVEEN